MQLRRIGGVEDICGLQRGDHVCWSFRSDDEFWGTARRYLDHGHQAGEMLAFLAPPAGVPEAIGRLEAAGLPAGDLVHRGHLTVIDGGDFYAPEGQFDGAAALTGFREAAAAAAERGYAAVRCVGDGTWLVPGVADGDDLCAYEAAADELVAGLGNIGLCGYDARRWPAPLLERLGAIHPLGLGGAAGVSFRLFATRGGMVGLAGDVDFTVATTFAGALRAAGRARPADLVIDLAELDFIDVRGLNAVRRLAGDLARAGRTVTLTGARPVVRRCVQLLGLDKATGLVLD